MSPSPVPRTTHTVEMAQIAELNRRLGDQPDYPEVTAADLGLTGVALRGTGTDTLPATAVLDRLYWEGSPEFPYIHGRFSGDHGSLRVDLHTAALAKLAHHLRVQQRWGIDP